MSSRLSARRRSARVKRELIPNILMNMELFANALSDGLSPRRSRTRSRGRKNTTRGRATRSATAVRASAEVVDLDKTTENSNILKNVDSKISNFLQSGGFISSDEDEDEMIKAKINKKPSPKPFFISDDSDDDCKPLKEVFKPNFDSSKPSTSAGHSNSPFKADVQNEDDIMDLVDSILDKKDDKKESPLKDLKSLEEYRKETEEMLKNASAFLEEFKGNKPPIIEKNTVVESPKATVGACPVCLESLATRAAYVTVCGHIFCKECITQTAQALKKCPTCRKAINLKKIHPVYF